MLVWMVAIAHLGLISLVRVQKVLWLQPLQALEMVGPDRDGPKFMKHRRQLLANRLLLKRGLPAPAVCLTTCLQVPLAG
jgi:hypothetical protein